MREWLAVRLESKTFACSDTVLKMNLGSKLIPKASSSDDDQKNIKRQQLTGLADVGFKHKQEEMSY